MSGDRPASTGPLWYSMLWLVLLTLNCVTAVTHWVVTERGRIQASPDSAFQLRRPYDLAALFQQMERANELKDVRSHLRDLKPSPDSVPLDEGDIWELQKQVMETDENCKAAGKPVYEFDFYTSTVLPFSHFGIRLEDHINTHSVIDLPSTSLPSSKPGVISKNNAYQEPKCWLYKLDFSMHSLEHLDSIRNRQKISTEPETALRSVVLPNGMTVDQFGHAVHQALKKVCDFDSLWINFVLFFITDRRFMGNIFIGFFLLANER